MGACQSGDAETGWDDLEAEGDTRFRTDKMTGELVAIDEDDDNRPDDDCFVFEADEVVAGEQFLSVRPWKAAAAVEPSDHPPVDDTVPDVSYVLEHVYGYRCQDSKQNVYYNPAGNLCYMTACLGVILDKAENTQTFFGGGEVPNTSKQVASSANGHSNDVMCLKVNTDGDRTLAVSGQVGKHPAVFVWNTETGEKVFRTQLAKNARGVSACCINADGSLIATADRSNDHMVSVFDTASGDCKYQEKGGPDLIHDMAFAQDGSNCFWSVGIKHI